MKTQNITVESLCAVRVDKYLAEVLPELSRSALSRILEEGGVLLGGKPVSKSTKVAQGDEIVLTLPDPKPCRAEAEEIALDVVYEDADLLVVNKPRGMVVHPAAGNDHGTLVNALLSHCGDSLSGINGVLRPGIVHRIDKDTSGLLIVAKNDTAHAGLARQIKEHSFEREYEAVVVGNLPQDEGTVNAPVGRHPVKRMQMAVTEKNSKPAVTHYRVLERLNGYTYVRLRLETGRTHQIRVHMAYLGHPVAGDPLYGTGRDKTGFTGQCLHARHIGFTHPVTGEWLSFESELPADFAQFLQRLRARS